MLILTRKENSRIFVRRDGVEIEIVVTEIRPGKVRIGIHAPPDYVIWRDDIDPTTTPTPKKG